MADRCPPNAPPGSVWTVINGRFGCKAPDGTQVPTTGGLPPGFPPIGGGAPGPLTGTPGRLPTSTPYTSVPSGFPSGGAGGGVPGGGSGSPGWVNPVIGGGLGLAAILLDYYGKKRTTDAQNENNAAANAQARADMEGRAHAGASIYEKVLSHYGHGDLASPDELYNALLREPSPSIKVAGPSIFGAAGKVADEASAGVYDYMQGQRGTAPPVDGNSQIWQQILDLLLKQNGGSSPIQGGSAVPDYWQD